MASIKLLAASILLAAGLAVAPSAWSQGSATLSLTGKLVDATTFSVEQLRQLPQTEIAELREVERHEGERDRSRKPHRIVYRGVLLRDVIDASGFKENQRHDFRRTLFVAKASDGYLGVFSWGELFNSDEGKQVLVIIDADGKPLPASEGPIALRSLSDLRPGPRHIRWLQEVSVIEVEK